MELVAPSKNIIVFQTKSIVFELVPLLGYVKV